MPKNLPTKSPLKDAPLRNPGQSVEEEISKITDDDMLIYALGTAFGIGIAAWEWYRFAFEPTPNPWLLTFFGIPFAAYCCLRALSLRKRLRNLRQGRDGEKVVGQYLERLRADGCVIFHDIVGPGFNIDHVVISPKGIFTIETKTFSKPAKGKSPIIVSNSGLSFNGAKPDPSFFDQAEGQATWLRDTIKSSTGRSFPIKPAIVFPGWFVEPLPKNFEKNIWVLNPKALPSFIQKEPDRIKESDLHLISFHIGRYIRTT